MAVHQVLLNAVDKTSECLGWSTEQSINYGARSATIEFTYNVSPVVPDTIEIKGDYNGTLYTVFKGVISEVKRKIMGKTWICECLDYTYYLFFRQVLAKQYKDKKAHEIIQDLITTYISDITTTNVAITFTTLYDKSFDKVTVFEAIRHLADAEDADFWVRTDKDLYFKPRTAASSALVSLTQGTNILDAEEVKSDRKLFNWIRFIGGVGLKPLDKDIWTENSGWDKSGDLATLAYDGTVKYTGSYSVKTGAKSPSSSYPSLFWRPTAKDLNMLIEGYTKLYLRLRASYLTWQVLRIELHKDANNYLYQGLTLTAADTWEQKTLDVGVGSSGWTAVGSFNWASDPINYIQIHHVTDEVTVQSEITETIYNIRLYNGSYIRGGERLTLQPGVYTKLQFRLRKYGSPTGTGYVRIRAIDDSILAEFGSIDVSTIPTTETWMQFTGYLSLATATEVRILLEYDGGTSLNYVNMYHSNANTLANAVLTTYVSSWTDDSTKDMNFKILGNITERLVYIDELYFYDPQLVVEDEDTTSQTTYRRRDVVKSDNLVGDKVWAQSWITAQLGLYKNPYPLLKVSAIFLPGQIEAGQKVTVTISDFGISAQEYRVLSSRFSVPACRTELELCTVLPLSLEETLANLRRELADVIRRTA